MLSKEPPSTTLSSQSSRVISGLENTMLMTEPDLLVSTTLGQSVSDGRRSSVLSSQLNNTQTNRGPLRGSCPVCYENNICIIPKTGGLRKHGHGGGRPMCSGSYAQPATSDAVEFSLNATDIRQNLGSGVGCSQSNNATRPIIEDSNLTHNEPCSLTHPPAFSLLRHIPKAARSKLASTLGKLLQDVVDNPLVLQPWQRLLGFANACLVKPVRGGKSRNLTSRILQQCTAFEAGEQVVSVNSDKHSPDAHVSFSSNRSKCKNNKSGSLPKNDDLENLERKRANRASLKLGDGDVKGAIRTLCSDETIAECNSLSFEKLCALHPAAPTDRRKIQCPSSVSLRTTPNEVLAAVNSFPNGSAGGPDDLRPQHIKELLSAQGENGLLLESLTNFINLLLEGTIPPFVQPIFFGATLLAFNKKTGGLRPIAVGYTLRRLAAKVCCRHVVERGAAFLKPKQLGFGVRGGAEAVVHAARGYLSALEPEKAMLKIDFSNAFNCLRRDAILESISKHFPEIYQFVSCAYGSTSMLQFGTFIILSDEGAQQGDPLGPLLFCMATHDLWTNLNSEFVAAYLDDCTMGASSSTLVSDFRFLEAEAAKLGLHLNRSKCELVGASEQTISLFKNSGIQIPVVPTESAFLLGAPLNQDSLDEAIREKNDDLLRMASRIKYLPAHDSLFLLRNALGIPKVVYLLRTSPCFQSNLLQEFDSLLLKTLQTILNIDFSSQHWKQASLPVAYGGLGIRSTTVSLAPSAFLASAASTCELVSSILPINFILSTHTLDAALDAWRRLVPADAQPPSSISSHKQSTWDSIVCASIAGFLLQSQPCAADQARLLAVRSPGSGLWLEAFPLATMGLHMDNDIIRIACALRLGAPIGLEHSCICGSQVSTNGHHGLACIKSAGRHPRHADVNSIVHRAFQTAGVCAIREPNGLCVGDGKRPDGVTLAPWRRGKCLAWDFTCPDTLAPSHLKSTRFKAGAAAETAEASKFAKYATLLPTHEVIPIAIETLGTWGQEAWEITADLGSRLASVTKEPRSTVFLRQRISIAIQRGNAMAVLGTHTQWRLPDSAGSAG